VGAAAPAALWNVGGWRACVALVVLLQALGVAIALTFWKQAERRVPEDAFEIAP
jgi:hypothetical protein